MKGLLIAAALLAMPSASWAYYAIGAGTGSCGAWTANRRYGNGEAVQE